MLAKSNNKLVKVDIVGRFFLIDHFSDNTGYFQTLDKAVLNQIR